MAAFIYWDGDPGRDHAQKPLKIWTIWAVSSNFWAFFKDKPLKPLKSCFKNRSKASKSGLEKSQ